MEIAITLLGVTIPAISGALGIKWQQAKNAANDAVHQVDLLSVKAGQAARLLDTISEALEDDKITASESKIITNQIKTLIGGLKQDE